MTAKFHVIMRFSVEMDVVADDQKEAETIAYNEVMYRCIGETLSAPRYDVEQLYEVDVAGRRIHDNQG